MKAAAMGRMAILALALALAGCIADVRRAGPLDAKAAARLAAIRVDPAAATAMLTAYRASRGLGPVRLDPALTAMAQRQANAMAAANALSHEAAGSFSSRVRAAGLDAARAAENLGAGYDSTQDAFAGWRASAGHDANLLLPQATRFGIALAKDPRTTYGAWWALVLAAEPERPPTLAAGPVGYFGSNRAAPE